MGTSHSERQNYVGEGQTVGSLCDPAGPSQSPQRSTGTVNVGSLVAFI